MKIKIFDKLQIELHKREAIFFWALVILVCIGFYLQYGSVKNENINLQFKVEDCEKRLGDWTKKTEDCRKESFNQNQANSNNISVLIANINYLENENKKLFTKMEELKGLIKSKSYLAGDKEVESKVGDITLSSKNISDIIKETKEKAVLFQKDIEKFQIEYLKAPLKSKMSQ